jgi:hypothetical protein
MNKPAKVIIEEIRVEAPFRYLWLKYVSGVDLSVHCADCLLGDYSELVSPSLGLEAHDLTLDEYEGEIFYLCGVAKPYDWDRNFHLAFRQAPGEKFAFEEHGLSVSILNAQRINFEAFDARNKSSSPNRTKPVFNTCRIWIFANHAQQAGLLS